MADKDFSLKINNPHKNIDVDHVEPIKYTRSPGLVRCLIENNISFIFTSYQSNMIFLVGVGPQGKLHVHEIGSSRPMGLRAHADGGFTVGLSQQIVSFRNILKSGEIANEKFDACYVPRQTYLTGPLDIHDVDISNEECIYFVSTRYNCISKRSLFHSFQPVWHPSFITSIVDEDRCHLNGFCLKEDSLGYASAISRSNTIDGWRDRRESGGVVINIKTNDIVAENLSMPHSPRFHDGKLWVLNSGTGEIGFIDESLATDRSFLPVAFCPGFVRGLRFVNNLAFVGLSKPRYERFTGLDLDRRLRDSDSEPWCGVQIIDINNGTCVDWLRLDGPVGELFDVEILSGVRCPMALAPGSHDAAALVTFSTSE